MEKEDFEPTNFIKLAKENWRLLLIFMLFFILFISYLQVKFR